MRINGIPVEATFAEAFPMQVTRLIVTGHNRDWARHAAQAATGFATSVIACGCEAGIEREIHPRESPDGRPGFSLLLFAMSGKKLSEQLQRRVGQCILTCPSSACFSGFDTGENVPMGGGLRYFGDGFQIAKQVGEKRYWRIPVMDGEFLCEESARRRKDAIGGGNFLIIGRDLDSVLGACERAVRAIGKLPEVITPFPGGVVRSGSKVGSKYPSLPASTNHHYCPTLKGAVASALPEQAGCVLEIVINGLRQQSITTAMRKGIGAACGKPRGLLGISAGNYGGKLGPFHFPLRKICRDLAS